MKKAFAQTSNTSTMTKTKHEMFSLKRGIKVYCENSHATVQAELSQAHDRGVFEP